MSRRSSGLIGSWAEAQRQDQRRREAQRWAGVREQQAAYRRQREADVLRRTQELDARVAVLEGLLVGAGRRHFEWGP
ncbi:hypothetical protein [Streptomyces sp. NPDC002889]|uniref:hypothetical protein n=1 Tax=Streptomyces sp. NPDC002889 TaxID=3364669 RepID=UPI00367E44B3